MKGVLFSIILFLVCASTVWADENASSTDQMALSGESSSVNQDQLIEQLLEVSGLKKTLQQLQEQVNPSIKQRNTATGESGELQQEMVKLYSVAYPKHVFVTRVKDVLKRNYDEKRYLHLLQLLSTPLAIRIADLESTAPSPVDFNNYVSQVALHPLSADRIRLIQRIDTATRSSEMMNTITIASIESNAIAMSDGCMVNVKAIKNEIGKRRSEIEKATRSEAQVMLSFTYRDVSDADLGEYIEIYEAKDSKWLHEYVRMAIEEQFKSGIMKVGMGMKKLIQSHKPKKTMFAPKCNDPEITNEDIHNNHPIAKARYPKGPQDLRDCLAFEDSAKVIACTEKAHKTH
jgi:hypothetical protein